MQREVGTAGFSARGLMRHYRVETVCTTDDPVDSLEHHIATKASGFEIRMLPTWAAGQSDGRGESRIVP